MLPHTFDQFIQEAKKTVIEYNKKVPKSGEDEDMEIPGEKERAASNSTWKIRRLTIKLTYE